MSKILRGMRRLRSHCASLLRGSEALQIAVLGLVCAMAPPDHVAAFTGLLVLRQQLMNPLRSDSSLNSSLHDPR